MKKILDEVRKTNANLRKNRTISKTLSGLSNIDYKNDRANAWTPLMSVAGEVAKTLGYGQAGGSQLPTRVKNQVAAAQLTGSARSRVVY